MNASKENARRALDLLPKIRNDGLKVQWEQELTEFLQAAERKLPSEAAYDRSKKRAAPRMTNRGYNSLSSKITEDLPGM